MNLIETFEISHEDIFGWKFTICTEIVCLMWVLCTISEVTQTLVLNLFYFFKENQITFY